MTEGGKPVGIYDANVLIASPESATSSSLGGGGGSGIVGFFCGCGTDGAPEMFVLADVLLFIFANNAARIAASVAKDAADYAGPEVLDIAYGRICNDLVPITQEEALIVVGEK